MLDSNSELVEGVDFSYEEAQKWCAPIEDTNYSTSYYVRDYNNADMKYHLFVRKSNSADVGEVDGDFDYDSDYMDWVGDDYDNGDMGGVNMVLT